MIQLNNTWNDVLKSEFNKDYFQQLLIKIDDEYETNTIYPPKNQIFNAFNQTNYEDVKVVILGQDPYFNEGQANGLAFSVYSNQKIPKSLQNIIKELITDVSIKVPEHGDLTSWASQGVLLLNTVLTVKAGEPGSHRGIGWERFTDAIIRILNKHSNRIVYLLWGNDAKSKVNLIDTTKHYYLTAPHPSPLSAYRGFLGCKHFSQTNDLLAQNNYKQIDWNIT